MEILSLMGWTGSIMLALCALPETIKAIRTKKCSLTLTTILLWLFGEVLVLIPICILTPKGWLIVNYGTNVILTLILLYYKIYGRK